MAENVFSRSLYMGLLTTGLVYFSLIEIDTILSVFFLATTTTAVILTFADK